MRRTHGDVIGPQVHRTPPERHEPDIGEVNYTYLYRLFDELGYDGWVGCEYRPRAGTSEGLGPATPLLRSEIACCACSAW